MIVSARQQHEGADGGVTDPARPQRLLLRRDGALGARRALRRQARHGVQVAGARRRRRRDGTVHLPGELCYLSRKLLLQPFSCDQSCVFLYMSYSISFLLLSITRTVPSLKK